MPSRGTIDMKSEGGTVAALRVAAKDRGTRHFLALLLCVLAVFTLAACSGQDTDLTPRSNRTIKADPAPDGWVNSADGAFRIKIPENYHDAFETVGGKELPDAQVILSMSSDLALNGYIPALVIDHSQVVSDPKDIEAALKKDDIYKDYANFTVLNPVKVEGMNVLEMKWNYVYQEVQMTAFLSVVSANNHSYALKQDVPDYALEAYQPIIDTVLKTWTWNKGV